MRVFFVISGFLIAGWSLKRWEDLSNIELRRFYVMRFARIVPCLIALLTLLAFLDRAGVPNFAIAKIRHFAGYGPHPSLPHAIFAALTFHINVLEARTGYLPAAWDVLWSLSVEEVFYIFFPLVCVLVRKQSFLIPLFLGLMAIGPFARVVLTHNAIWAEYGYFSCMDGIALGCLAALVAARMRFVNGAKIAMFSIGISLCVLIQVFRGTTARLGLYKGGLDETVLEVGIALLIIVFQQRFESGAADPSVDAELISPPFWSRVLRSPSTLVQWFGRKSYEIYLTHALVMWPMVMLFQNFHQPLKVAPFWFLVYLVIAGCLGGVISRYYSEPLNRVLRQQLMPKQAIVAPLTGLQETTL